MNIKRVLAGLSAAAVAGSLLATTAFADEPTVYGIAGVSFQVKDSWEHRDAVGQDLLDESGKNPFDATCYDVNITGNGTYEVSLVGWWCDFDEAEMGWVSLDTTIPVTQDDEGAYIFADYPDATITIDSYTEDGNEYDLSEAEITTEDDGNGYATYKIVNAWGKFDARGEEYEYLTWTSTDPVVIKFTVSGLPTDKEEDYEDEVIEYVSGNGAPADTGDDDPADDGDTAADTESSDDTTSDSADSADTGDATTDTASSAATSSTTDDEGSNLPLYLGIGGGVVVIAAIIAIIIKVKK